MKSVLISIQPKWCELIANGEKTLEVRKTRPKLETPFKVYIYCTNRRPYLVWGDVFRGDWETEFTDLYGYSRDEAEKIWDVFNGHIIGEFVCDYIFEITTNYEIHDELPGSPAETWLEWNDAPDGYETMKELEKASRLSYEEIKGYVGMKGGYGWHISILEIYDTPKDISEFRKACGTQNCDICQFWENTGEYAGCLTSDERRLRRPPQSWCYVEEV